MHKYAKAKRKTCKLVLVWGKRVTKYFALVTKNDMQCVY